MFSPVGCVFAVVLLLIARESVALEEFLLRVPNGNNVPNHLRLGHVTETLGNNALNRFGIDFRSAGFQWTRALCLKDSDGDGFTNGYELGDETCTWTPQNPTPLRTINLSHPGLASNTPATSAPTRPPTRAPTGRPTAQPTRPPTLQPTLQPTSTSSPTAPTAPTPPTTPRPSKVPTAMPTVSPSTSEPTSSPIPADTDAPSSGPLAPDTTGSDGSNDTGLDAGGDSEAAIGAYTTNLFTAHAVIMSLGFGLFLPLAVVVPAVPSLRASPRWFFLHRLFIAAFFILAWIGFLIAMISVAVEDRSLEALLETDPTVHGPLGIAVMVMLTCQALLGYFRPHLPKAGEVKTTLRKAFELAHPFLGRLIVVLAAVQMFLGYRLLSDNYLSSNDARASLMAWAYFQAFAMPIGLLLVVSLLKFRKWRSDGGGANKNATINGSATNLLKADPKAQPSPQPGDNKNEIILV
jgi:hypothetical protein